MYRLFGVNRSLSFQMRTIEMTYILYLQLEGMVLNQQGFTAYMKNDHFKIHDTVIFGSVLVPYTNPPVSINKLG